MPIFGSQGYKGRSLKMCPPPPSYINSQFLSLCFLIINPQPHLPTNYNGRSASGAIAYWYFKFILSIHVSIGCRYN